MSEAAAKAPGLRAAIMRQFGKPSGLLGRVVGLVLANRPSNVQRNRFTVEQLALGPGDRVLEVGCGPGVALKQCLDAAPSISCAGLDHSELMIDMARDRNCGAARSGRLHLIIGGLESLAFAGGGLTKVMMINVAMFVPDRPAMFARLKGAMISPGRIVVTHQPRNAGATDTEGQAFAATLAAELAAAGFTRVRTEALPLKPVAAQCVIAEL